jgi:hypothetical protein
MRSCLQFLNLNDDMPLLKGSTIINLILICLMNTFFSLTCFLLAKYLMLIYLFQLPYLLFLVSVCKRGCTSVSKKINFFVCFGSF